MSVEDCQPGAGIRPFAQGKRLNALNWFQVARNNAAMPAHLLTNSSHCPSGAFPWERMHV